MKKTIMASGLALALGVTGISSTMGGEAHAAEQTSQGQTYIVQAGDTLNKISQQFDTTVEDLKALNGLESDLIIEGQTLKVSGQEYVQYQQQNYSQVSNTNYEQSYAQESEQVQQPQQAEQTQVQQPQQAEQTQVQEAPQVEQPKQNTQSQSTASSNSSSDIPAHLQTIVQRESGGDIRAINPSSGAAGKYQFMQSTWDSVAPAGWAGKSPASAPESVQDQAALALYDGGAGASHWVTA